MRSGQPEFVLAAPTTVTLAGQPDANAGADADGRFSCVASVFERRIPRPLGDILLRSGCFNRSLTERGLPSLVWSHDWQTPPIGITERCAENTTNLEAAGRLFIADDEQHPRAREVHLAMSSRNADGRAPLREFSIGFDVVDARWEIDGEAEVLAIHDADLYEFGPCLVGAVAGTGFLRAPTRDELLERFPRRPLGDRLERARATSRSPSLAPVHGVSVPRAAHLRRGSQGQPGGAKHVGAPGAPAPSDLV